MPVEENKEIVRLHWDECRIAGATNSAGGSDMAQRVPQICGVHHIKLPVHDPAVSRDFYCRILGFEEEISFREEGVLMGVALIHPQSGVRYAVRREPERAAALRSFDPVALAVSTRSELEAWVAYLDEQGVEHGPIMNGHIGWVVGFDDPHGIEVRLYTLERPEDA
jgi:catechol 2,3-dioxygenase-like lactoylglutathione lyase family enzyme